MFCGGCQFFRSVFRSLGLVKRAVRRAAFPVFGGFMFICDMCIADLAFWTFGNAVFCSLQATRIQTHHARWVNKLSISSKNSDLVLGHGVDFGC